MKLTITNTYRKFKIGIVIGVIVLGIFTIILLNARNPLIEYRGDTMRKSVMLAERPGEVFCQQMSSFSLGVMYTCFDSEAELDAFAERR